MPYRRPLALLLALPAVLIVTLALATPPSVAASLASPPIVGGPPYFTDTVDSSGWHQITLYNGATPPPATFLPGASWYKAVVHWTLSDGTARQYQISIPAGLVGAAPYVVALHGYAQGVASARAQQNWEALAPARHFVVVYGVGQPNASWNAGQCCSTAVSSHRDDSLYLAELLRLVPSEWALNPHRIYLAGFSNGAMMAYRYACEHPGQIAAIGVVAGTNEASCTPGPGTGAVAIRHIHGAADSTVPYYGQRYNAYLRCALTPVPTALREWARADSGSSWAVVSHTVVPGMGHVWPRGAPYGLDATSNLWGFFFAHPRP